MANLKKITTGMANGPEAIDENFTSLTKVYTKSWSSNGITIALERRGDMVTGVFGGSQSNVAQGFTYDTPLPSGYKPSNQIPVVVAQTAVSNFNINTNGVVRYWGLPSSSGTLSGSFAYFTNDPFPTS